MVNHREKFMSAICTCGQHKNNAPTTNPAHLTGCSEYSKNYIDYPTQPPVHGKPMPQELKVGGEFSGSTESRSQYSDKPIPPKFERKKNEYVPNSTPLQSVTTQRQDYPSWPGVKPPQQKAKDVYKGSSGTFDGLTINKLDYKEFGQLPPRFRHEVPKYVKNPVKFEGVSTQSTDFTPKASTQRPLGKHADPYHPTKDDRNFKSEIAASYTGQRTERMLVKAVREYVPSAAKFEGHSASQDAYQPWALPPRYRHEKAKYVADTTPFEKHSSYASEYTAKTTDRYIHPIPAYAPLNTAKFDAKSTNQADFPRQAGKVERAQDYSPKNAYAPTADDRDFVSSTRGAHTAKALPGCPAAEYAKSTVRASR